MQTQAVERSKISAAVTAAMSFLESRQLESGEFELMVKNLPPNPEYSGVDHSVFATALIAHCISFLESAASKRITEGAIRFFLSEMGTEGVWTYWTRDHIYRKYMPPDIDDTACISAILEQNGVKFPENKELLLSNKAPSGLLYTWITPRLPLPLNWSYWHIIMRQNPIYLHYFWKNFAAKSHDVDSVVNANAVYYLGDSQITRPIIDWLIGLINSDSELNTDKWYLSPFNLYYAISRNYNKGISSFEAAKESILRKIRQASDLQGMIGSHVLDTALAVSTLHNFRYAASQLENSIGRILAEQNSNGGWDNLPLYYGGKEKPCCFGAETLTTAFCVEALHRFNVEASVS